MKNKEANKAVKKDAEAKKAETKKRILKNSGQAIEHFRDLKKISIIVLAKKSGIKISDVNDICTGKKIPKQKEVIAICKVLNIPKETILLYSIEEKDVAPKKREAFKALVPSIKKMVDSIAKKENNTSKKTKSKAKSIEKKVAKVIKPKKNKKTKK